MPQKIKKQIKRSMPWFVIFSLIINSVVIGLVFNFNFKFNKSLDKDLSIELASPQAQAQNSTATTSVQVQNAPPTITGGPAESPASTSTSPVNIGGQLDFTVTATDDEGNGYWLIICTTNSVTASGTAGPTCDGVQLCVSTATTSSGAPNSCTYSPVTDPPGETREWYAFVCDDHTNEGACSSPGNQGSGDSGSPFYINHAPYIDEFSTSINDQIPGGTFEVSATSTDTDVLYSADELTMHICDNGGYATSTGCLVNQYCTATGTAATPGASTTISCQWDDVAPTPDTFYVYYVYIKDEHGLPASNNGATSTYTVINVAPYISYVKLMPNDGNEIQLALKATTTVVTASSTENVVDQNGCTDMLGATSTIYWSVVSNGYSCTADDDKCYKIASTSCTITDCTGDDDANATVTCTTSMAFHAMPTDGSSYYATTTWYAAIFAFDEALTGATSSKDNGGGTDVKTNTALEVDETLIQYGLVQAGSDTGTSTATTTVNNIGNSPLDCYLYGINMIKGGDTIEIWNQKHDLNAYFDYNTQGTNATSTPSSAPHLQDLDAPKPYTGNTNIFDYAYWGIGVPGGRPSGTYEGLNTFQLNIDPNGQWGN
jgi:hypothetical protein